MISHLDHVTVVVRDVEKAKEFFKLLGFEEEKNVTISGEKFEKYMGVAGIKAEHHTLVLKGSSPRPALSSSKGMEVQLLRYIDPKPIPDPNITTLREVGYNHICFAVDDIERNIASAGGGSASG